MIDQRAAALERSLHASAGRPASSGGNNGGGGGGRGQLAVQFFEKRRRRAWLSRGDDEVCWEVWTVKVTVAEPRTDSGTCLLFPSPFFSASWPPPLLSCQSEQDMVKKGRGHLCCPPPFEITARGSRGNTHWGRGKRTKDIAERREEEKGADKGTRRAG